jgi:cell division initiation protein
MPDESTAASEHALLQEITAPLATLPDNPLPDVAGVDFPVALRGYDRLAVDAYVKRTSQLVAELQATRSPEAAVRRGLERVGEEVAGILQRAHEAASQITAQSRSEAEDRLERARQEATQITASAQQRLQELDSEVDRIWAERQRIVEDAQQLAQQLLSLAQSAAERFPAAEDTDTTTQDGSRLFGSGLPGRETRPGEPEDVEENSNGLVEDAPELAPGPDAATGPEDFGEPDTADTEEDTTSTRIMPPIQPREDEAH